MATKYTSLIIFADKIISQITLWLGNAYDIERIKNFYIKLGVERKKAGAKISVLSALSLIRKHT